MWHHLTIINIKNSFQRGRSKIQSLRFGHNNNEGPVLPNPDNAIRNLSDGVLSTLVWCYLSDRYRELYQEPDN